MVNQTETFKKMSEKLKESLSAVIDGEADEFELRRVLDEIGKDAELAMSWERYHMIGSVMRRERVARGNGMRDRIRAEVQTEAAAVNEPVLVAEETTGAQPAGNSAFRRWASLAAVAVLVIAAAVGFNDLPENGGQGTATIAADEGPGQQQSLDQAIALNSEVTKTDQVRTDAYTVYHMQQLGMNQSGFGGFAKMVAYQRR